MWKVITSAGGFLGVYKTAEQAMAVAKEYNRKGNRPGTASVSMDPKPSSKKKSPWKKSSSMYGKSTGGKKKKGSSDKPKKSKGFMSSSFGVDDYPSFGGYSGQSASGQSAYTPPPKSLSTGGVVISDDGRILVREVANKFSGVAWSIAKGGVDAGETEEQAALREVLEETGWVAEIVERIPGEWEGSTTRNRYFLMRPVQNTGEWQYMGTSKEETWSVAWVPLQACSTLFHLGSKSSAKRDTEVVETAWQMWLKTEAGMAWKSKREKKPKSGGFSGGGFYDGGFSDFPDFEG
jgi:8-oxo-dGTP pyrophosphatase MutT (NUDIX family)